MGQWWTATVTVPDPFGGNGVACYAQLITPDRETQAKTQQGITLRITAQDNGKTGLDVKFPYGTDRAINLPPLQDGDNPYQLYAVMGATVISNYASDNFVTWMMYKPSPIVPNQQVTYVPLQKYEWTWTGSTLRNNTTGKYDIRRGIVMIKSPRTDTSLHPTWERIIVPTNYDVN
jgi:hypothetical protein